MPRVAKRQPRHGLRSNVLMNRANDGAAPAPQETCLRQASVPVVGSAFRSIFEQSNREEETSLRRTDRCRRTYRLPNESGGPPRRRPARKTPLRRTDRWRRAYRLPKESGGPPRRRRSRKTPLLGGRGRSRRRNLGGRTTPHADRKSTRLNSSHLGIS